MNTQGTTGAAGSVTSSATVADPDVAGFAATEAASTCTATEAGSEGSTTILAGTLATKRDATTGEPVTTIDIPATPPPNDTYSGTIDNVGDSFRAVFNEQVVSAGGITVNAVHFYLLGPIAVGDLVVGQSVCGITSVAGSTTSSTNTSPSSTTSTTTPSTSTTSTTSSVPVAVGSATPGGPTPDPGTVNGPTLTARSALARTGYTSGLTMLAALTIAIGLLLLIGSGGGVTPVHARHGVVWPEPRVGGWARRVARRPLTAATRHRWPRRPGWKGRRRW
ncbi:MAG: hypothetical protein ACR2HV_05620 [Acidimicrobiales bacterium]